MEFKDAVNTLLSGFQGMIDKAIEAAPFDKTYRGRIVAVDGNKYSVQINGTIHEIKSNGVYMVGDSVDVLVPKNNWNNATILAPARLGTILQTKLNTVNSWTPSSAGATYDAASLTLPSGTWLVIGHFMDYAGYLRMWINGASGVAEHAAHDNACSSWTMDCFAITTGSRTVTLHLYAQKASVTHNWTQDGNYWKLYAVRIG